MNWRLILSHSRAVDALTTVLRIVVAVSLVAGGWLGTRLYTASSNAAASQRKVQRSIAAFDKLRSEYDRQKVVAGTIPREQLECDAPAQFAALVSAFCIAERVRVTRLQSDSVERIPIDNMEGSGNVSGWKSLGHDIEVVGGCGGVHAVLARMEDLPMPFELGRLDLKRVGVGDSSGSVLQLTLLVEVYEPGTPGSEQSGGSTT
jgi:hypothetical protein